MKTATMHDIIAGIPTADLRGKTRVTCIERAEGNDSMRGMARSWSVGRRRCSLVVVSHRQAEPSPILPERMKNECLANVASYISAPRYSHSRILAYSLAVAMPRCWYWCCAIGDQSRVEGGG